MSEKKESSYVKERMTRLLGRTYIKEKMDRLLGRTPPLPLSSEAKRKLAKMRAKSLISSKPLK